MMTDGPPLDDDLRAATTDAALSLCLLGWRPILSRASPGAGSRPPDGNFTVVRDAPEAGGSTGKAKCEKKPQLEGIIVPQDGNFAIVRDAPEAGGSTGKGKYEKRPQLEEMIRPPDGDFAIVRDAPEAGGSTGKGKYEKKPQIEEMIRLMRVYGPIRSQRDKILQDGVKPDSIKRKFSRWFPDFAERFEKAEDGRFVPRAGHELEMQYREGLRRKDEKKGRSARDNPQKKHYTRVPIEEIRRLMRVYGPLSKERQRAPCAPAATIDSIKRKFHRWFPDFAERFEKTPDGCFAPRAGHLEEMRYREELRQELRHRELLKRMHRGARTATEDGSKISIVG